MEIVGTETKPEEKGLRLPDLGFLTRLIVFVFVSWVLIHAFALLGVFVAFAYPLWYLFFPRRTICFLCSFKTTEYFCPFCKRHTQPGQSRYAENLRSAILNGVLIIIFSIISFGLIFVETQILNYFGIPKTEKTVSFIIPAEGQYKIGEIFPMDIKVGGIKIPVNAVQADITFDREIIECVDVITDYSFATVFIQKSINNDVGYARLTGGVPNPGYSGENGVFGQVLFRAKAPGTVKVEFLPTSLVLANDGKGTNVLKEFSSASYLILPEHLTQDEVDLQTSILKDDVLGRKSEKTKLEFYDDSEVLGASTEEFEVEEVVEPWSFWTLLSSINTFILNFWSSVGEALQNFDPFGLRS